ncbi:hypothetical protein GCM10020367_21090 [Streptomyces sannanensis]|uniref:PIN domain-containing protein n=1 Tax=Streptomyces sannanensis TaxID=285536 RepID=A0ABP6S941_9ACTN
MRLKPGVTLDRAEDELRKAVMAFENAQSSQPYETLWDGYLRAFDQVLRGLEQTFADPDLAGGLMSPAFWNLFQVGGIGPAANRIVLGEVEAQLRVLREAEQDLAELKALAERPGVPVVVDTNVLLRWDQPDHINWRTILKDDGANDPQTRLVVPLVVLDELDRQKYGDGVLARRAATAIRYLDKALANGNAGATVRVKDGVTLEVGGLAMRRSTKDVDMQILLCAADLDQLNPHAGTRVLTGDIGMRLRAAQMGLRTFQLPENHRKPGTAMSDAPSAG